MNFGSLCGVYARGKACLKAFRQQEDGAILLLSLLFFVLILMISGIAVDMMRYEAERARMQGTADRAVLAATAMRQNSGGLTPEEIVQAYFDAEGLGDYVRGRIEVTEAGGSRTVRVTPEARMPTIFMRLAGVQELDMRLVSAASEGLAEVQVEIVLVLDVSGSMLLDEFGNIMPNPRIDDLHAAATEFVEAMLEDNDNGRVSITFVPYSTEVIMPPGTLTYFSNLSDPASGDLTNGFCIDFDTWDSVTNSLHTPMTRRNCDLRSNTSTLITDMPITPYVYEVSEAKDFIDTLWANWGTSIDLGLRTGAMFFDPTLRPVIDHLIDNGQVSGKFRDRPLDWKAPNSYRALVLMTDGANCCFHVGDAATRKPDRQTQDADTVSVCEALKEQEVVIYGVAFEAPQPGVDLMEACASSPGHFFNSSGAQLVAAFRNIATHIQTGALRLTQ
ncbi:Tad domain-containing protein [Roseinatronobacter bogoriensis]|uniref:Putative Flp pilus-assembly TadG-like N-terminal domain-containing protein n=2 Tax=Roseinatronobacter bogoriensis TaxID=119542 RepID=A0A2K8K6R5_9RHOB|nr:MULTISPECIES: Tad domain-containing protein [Rhodobaca]ATX65141.1 hypothetical protein BG454_04290 [Rhodobaca barguzinensis]TDW35374.1 putative Flp pilus-assembly TadE/G-like protein [Rhodobaca barguzinensis]TDY66584.1 putative Flp pilus-assembly TadE/G-like protein [Rhodobaca bogoriensis DSM 18756]